MNIFLLLKLEIKTLGGVWNMFSVDSKDTKKTSITVDPVSLMLILSTFNTLTNFCPVLHFTQSFDLQ